MSAKGPITQHFMQIHPRGASQQMGEIYAKIFIYIRIPFFLERTWRSDPLGDFYAWWLKRRGLRQESNLSGL